MSRFDSVLEWLAATLINLIFNRLNILMQDSIAKYGFEHINPAIKYRNLVIHTETGIQLSELDAGSNPT